MKDKTYSFVKETKRDIYWELRKKEIEFLRHPATGKIKEEFADPVKKCFLCESSKRDILFKKEGFTFFRCQECSFVYSDPQIKEDKLVSAYKSSLSNDAWIDVLLSQTNYRYDIKKYTTGLKKLEAFRSPGKILDIGCSIGLFLKLARDRGWDPLGLELNTRAVKYAREKWNLPVIEKLLSEADFADATFDVVTLWGVIEHLKHPSEVLKEVQRILVPGGYILTFCPNVESVVCRILHKEASCFDGRNHCGYFSPVTLGYLFKKCGFEVVEITSFQPELDTILNYLDFRNPYLKESEKENPIKELIGSELSSVLEKILLDRKIGYKMMTLGRKIRIEKSIS
ncbi:MAG: class I SAM-dependent methyltransferase [Candidatus Paceibacterales bacterium]